MSDLSYIGNQPTAVPLTSDQLGDGIVTTPKIADLAVTTAKLADLNVTTGKIANLAVTTGKIALDAVTGAQLANNIDIAGTLDVTGLLTADAGVTVVGALTLGGTAVTSTAAELNILDGVTATAAEVNYLDIAVLGLTQPSKAVTADANGVVTHDAGISEEYTSVTSSSNVVSLNLQLGNNFSHDLTENTTISFANPADSGKVSAATLRIIQGSTARTITWNSSIKWAAATAPVLSTGSGNVDVFVFYTVDAWYNLLWIHSRTGNELMTVATKIMMGSGAVAEAYEIEQSLIFQPNAHLSRNVSPASNRRTWTWSAWVKRSKITLSNDQMIFNAAWSPSANNDDSTYFAIRFARTAFGAQTDALCVNAWNTNYRITNRLFRDVSAWYHIVVVLDTTQSTADNRIKVYINGTQETSFSDNQQP